MRYAALFSLLGSFAPDERPQEESPHPNRRSAKTAASKQEEIVEFPPVVVTPTREAERADRVAHGADAVLQELVPQAAHEVRDGRVQLGPAPHEIGERDPAARAHAASSADLPTQKPSPRSRVLEAR